MNAKERFYANQAKKGVITPQQATTMAKPLSLLGKVNQKLAQRQVVQPVQKPTQTLAQRQVGQISPYSPEYLAKQGVNLPQQNVPQQSIPAIQVPGVTPKAVKQESTLGKIGSFLKTQASNLKWGTQHPKEVATEVKQNVKGFFTQDYGYSPEEIKKAEPTIHEKLSGLAKYPLKMTKDFLTSLGRGLIELDTAVAKRKGDTKRILENEEALKRFDEGTHELSMFEPKTAGEAKTMKFADIASLIPLGTLKAERLTSKAIQKLAEENIESAAVKVGDKVYEGASHAEAIKAAQQAGEKISMAEKEAKGLFKLKSGELITRDEAEKVFGIRSSSEVPHLKAQQESPLIQEAKKYKSAMEEERQAIETMGRYGSQEAFGAVAGFEIDEQGNVKFDPMKAALGVGIMGGMKRVPVKVKSFVKPKEEGLLIKARREKLKTDTDIINTQISKSGSAIPKETTPPSIAPKPEQHPKIQAEHSKNVIEDFSYPESTTKLEKSQPEKLGTFRKWFTGGETILRKQGSGGHKLASTILKQRTEEDLLRGKYFKEIDDSFKNLSKKEIENVTDVLEGKAKSLNLKVSRTAKRMQDMLDEIGTRAEKDKFEIRIPTKEGHKSIPFSKRENYYPRKYDIDELTKGKKREEALDHMVKTGQARNKAEAEKVLDNFIYSNTQRRAGNLEYARTLDLPGYDKNAKDVLKSYVQAISRRFTESQYFGKKDEIAAKFIDEIAESGGDYREAQRIFEYTVDGAPKSKVVSAIKQFQMLTKLSLSAITNATQSVNTMTKAGVFQTTKDIFESFTKEGKDIAELSGIYDDFVYVRESGIKPGKILKAVMYPFKKVENFNRRVAAISGKRTAEKLINTLRLDKNNAFALRQLESLGIEPEKIFRGNITENDLLTAANKMVEKTQFRVDPIDVPPSWKTPIGGLITQFKSFSFMQTKFVRDEILREAKNGNFAPFMRFVVLAPAASYGAYTVRNYITGRKEKEPEKAMDIRTLDRFLKAVGTLPTEWVSQAKFLYDSYKNKYVTPLKMVGRTLGTVFGPTASDVMNIIAGVESVADIKEKQKKMRTAIAEGKVEKESPYIDLEREAAGKIPFVGQWVKNKYFAYPISKKTPEQKELSNKMYDFIDTVRKEESGSDKEKSMIQDYLMSLPKEERAKQKYVMEQEGISTKGISISEDVIKGRPMYEKVKELDDAGKLKESDEYLASLSDEEYKQYQAAEKSAKLQATNKLKKEKGTELKAMAEKVSELEKTKSYKEIEEIEKGLTDEEYNIYYNYLKKL